MASEILSAKMLASFFKPILACCPLWAGKKLHPVIIANAHSGGFTMKARAEKHRDILVKAAKDASVRQICVEIPEFPVIETEYAGHAAYIAKELIEKALKSPRKEEEFLIITAGGDGTSLEVQTGLLKAAFESEEVKKLITTRITVLRLPFGTGNDGSDGRTMDETLRRLTEPAEFALNQAVKVYYEGTEPTSDESRKKIAQYGSLDKVAPWYAFNIASIGIDAFITHNTNKFHNLLPGDFYKLCVDLACLFYNSQFPPKPAHIDVFDESGNIIKSIDNKVLFCLLGVSGHRTYGSGQKILPDDRNFCFTKKLSMFTMLFIKRKFLSGNHTDSKYVEMASATKIRIQYDQPILVQMDGEVHLLQKEHYPLVMELTEPVIRVIKLKSN